MQGSSPLTDSHIREAITYQQYACTYMEVQHTSGETVMDIFCPFNVLRFTQPVKRSISNENLKLVCLILSGQKS